MNLPLFGSLQRGFVPIAEGSLEAKRVIEKSLWRKVGEVADQ